MVGYKLSNNDWVTPFFVIFRSVREILLVTVFLEHPVLGRSVASKLWVHEPDTFFLEAAREIIAAKYIQQWFIEFCNYRVFKKDCDE